MNTRIRSTYVAALLVSGLALPAVLAVQGILSLASYAAVSTILLSLAVVAQQTYGNGRATRTLAELISQSDSAVMRARDFRWRM
jgi:hypothetical protein